MIGEIAATNLKEDQNFSSALSAIQSKLLNYYEGPLKKPIHCSASVLDPRIKLEYFKGREDSNSVKRSFLHESGPYKRCESADQVPTRTSDETPSWIARIFNWRRTSSFDDENRFYSANPKMEKDCNPLIY